MLIQVYISKFIQWLKKKYFIDFIKFILTKKNETWGQSGENQTKDLDKLSSVILLNCYFTQLSKIGSVFPMNLAPELGLQAELAMAGEQRRRFY